MSQDVWFRTVSIKWFPRIGACCALKSPMVPYTFDFQQNHKQVVQTNTCSFDTSNRYYYIYIDNTYIYILCLHYTRHLAASQQSPINQVFRIIATEWSSACRKRWASSSWSYGYLACKGWSTCEKTWGSSTYRPLLSKKTLVYEVS